MNYKCHICSLESKLNVLMSSHYKKAHTNIDKADYKKSLLSHNGREPKTCPICNKETTIPKGEKEYPQYHKKCYFKYINGENNPNYRGGKIAHKCRECNREILKHPSLILVKHPFCSTSCSMKYYAKPKNRTEAQKNSDIKGKQQLKKIRQDPNNKIAHAKALIKMQKDRKSTVEANFFSKLKDMYSDAKDQHILGFYTFDAYVPSIDALFEVNGNYWHNQKSSRSRDLRKASYIRNNKSSTLYTIWENEIKDVADSRVIQHAMDPVKIFILAIPIGVDKSRIIKKLGDQFKIIDRDSYQSIDRCIDDCLSIIGVKLIVTSVDTRPIAKELRNRHIRVWSCYLREFSKTTGENLNINRLTNCHEPLKHKIFQFYGDQQEILKWLTGQVN